jgi:ADP-heptose:LPS heptosyltransferase
MDEFLVIRLSSLGDIIHTLPAFAALRGRFPEARISWVASQAGRQVLDFVPGLDEVIVPGEDGWLDRLRRRERTALDFQGLLKSGLMAWRSKARRRLGFGPKNLREPLARFFYTERLPEVPEDDHVILKNLRLLRLLGLESEAFEFPLAIPDGLREGVRRKLADLGRPAGAAPVVFNLGAAWPTKRWFPERWAEVISSLDRRRWFPAVLWGNDAERKLAEGAAGPSKAAVLPFLSIGEVLALLKESALLVSGDTFALQAACALRVPVVAIFGPTSPRRNGPFAAGDRTAFHEIACSRCYRRSCQTLDCLKAVTAGEVSTLVREALKNDA